MKRTGFTLLDLLICVTIIGILCSVAIPAFSKYMDNSKKVEGKINLNAIGKGSIAFFNAEHPYDNGTQVYTRQYPSRGNPGRATSDSHPPIGGMPYGEGKTQMSVRHNPNDYKTEFNSYPWKDLNFELLQPFYFSYNYEGSNKNAKGEFKGSNKLGEKSYFASTASACLTVSCIDKKTCDVGYVIAGGPNGSLTPILDNSDWSIESDCGKALVGHVTQGLLKRNINLENY